MHWVEAACWGKTQNSQYSMRHSWLTKVIKAIWTFTDTMWTHRNSILHGKEIQAKTIRESSVNQQIVNFYGAQADFASTDRVIFDLPLHARLSLSFRSKKHWLVLANRYFSNTKDRSTGQQPLLTSFFPTTKRSLIIPSKLHIRPRQITSTRHTRKQIKSLRQRTLDNG